jgi:hypothetical protein
VIFIDLSVFRFFFFKKSRPRFFLKKEAKTFVHVSRRSADEPALYNRRLIVAESNA